MKMFLFLPLLFSLSAAADWQLTRVVYHGYCPPGAVKAGLCYFGVDFDTDEHPEHASIGAPVEVGDVLLNSIAVSDGDVQLGSEVRVSYEFLRWGRVYTRQYRYQLADNIEVLDGADMASVLLDGEGTIAVRNTLGREFDIVAFVDGCDLYISGDFTEPTRFPPNYVREATLTFHDSNCTAQ